MLVLKVILFLQLHSNLLRIKDIYPWSFANWIKEVWVIFLLFSIICAANGMADDIQAKDGATSTILLFDA